MAEDKSCELQVIFTSKDDGNTAEGSGKAGDVIDRENDGYDMAENNSIELEVIPPSKEHGNAAESSSEAGDVTSRQNDGSDGQKEDVGFLQKDSGENDGKSKESDSYDDDEIGDSDSGQQPDMEKELLSTVKRKEYQTVHGQLTAKALMSYSRNPLLFAIKITGMLHDRVKKNEPDKYNFVNMANRVEEFTMRFLDPLKYEKHERAGFFKNPETDLIMEYAIKLRQKKVFDHPVMIDLLNDKWHGGNRYLHSSKLWWLFLNVWCLFDMVLFPLTFLVTFVTGIHSGIHKKYKTYFTIPYFIFVRDMISYLALLALHLAICVQPSQPSFSGLEWAILFFFSGRLLTEIKQILVPRRSEYGETKCANFREFTKNYLRDRWNVFDLFIIVIFFCVIILRIVTLAVSGSVINKRAMVIAGYLYGFNTMLLTLRAVGSILETFEEAGTVQIALFHIIRDAAVIVLHFVTITVAFSSTITKLFVTEKSMVKEDITGKPLVCNKTGIQCWWKIATHLFWSLLDLSEGLSDLESDDVFLKTVAYLLFATYLIVAQILLINMLIALLSNTYQRVQDNSGKEWAFQKAIAIETYRAYHPIPVPFNIISVFLVWIYGRCKKKARETDQTNSPKENAEYEMSQSGIKETDQTNSPKVAPVAYLLNMYRNKYGDCFPPTDKLDEILVDADTTESMVNQVLYRTFTHQRGCDKDLLPTGPKAWETHKVILVEDYLITRQPSDLEKFFRCGARYKTAFSRRFPHFEIMIQEAGETRFFGLGVVFEDFGTDLFPGWADGTVGYHTDDRKIFDSENSTYGKNTIGANAARRGDVIRCTVLFEDGGEKDGKFQIPVVFSVNGSRIVPLDEKQPCIEYSEGRPLFPYIAFQYENSVLAKMCASEDIDYEGQEMKSNLTNVQSNIESKLECVRAEVQSKLECVRDEVQSKLECMQEKLDAVLAKLGANETK